MKLYKNISATLNGKPVRVDVEEYTRGGTKSPTLLIFIRNGKRYVPYSRERINLYLTFNGFFNMVYGEAIERVLPSSNPFLNLVKKTNFMGGSFAMPVILGQEHGITFAGHSDEE